MGTTRKERQTFLLKQEANKEIDRKMRAAVAKRTKKKAKPKAKRKKK
jgi:hypothetical protein